MSYYFRPFTYLILIFFISGCNPDSKHLPDDLANSLIVTYRNGSEIQSGETLEVLIENKTKYCLDFTPYYNIEINVDINGTLTLVKNNIIVSGNKPNILMPVGDPASGGFISVNPEMIIYNISKPIDASFQISGHLCDDENLLITKSIPFTILP